MKYSLSISSLVVALGAFGSAHAQDLFAGSYDSETRENFGRDAYGEFKIEISSLGPRKYLATISQGSRSLATMATMGVRLQLILRQQWGSDSNTVQLKAFFTRMSVFSFTFKGSSPFLEG